MRDPAFEQRHVELMGLGQPLKISGLDFCRSRRTERFLGCEQVGRRVGDSGLQSLPENTLQYGPLPFAQRVERAGDAAIVFDRIEANLPVAAALQKTEQGVVVR